MTTHKQRNKDEKKILQVYAGLGAALILSVIPNFHAAMMSLALGLAVLIMAYVTRKGREEGSLVENHMIYLIRTIWIGSFIGFLVVVAGSVYLYMNLDNTPLNECLGRFHAMGDSVYSIEVLDIVFAPCKQSYIQANLKALIISGAIVVVPTLLYFSMRFIRGLSRALKGYRVSDPLNWF